MTQRGHALRERREAGELRFRLPAQTALVFVLLVVGVLAQARSSRFLTHDNLVELLRNTSTYFIAACPLALLIIGGGLDFSVGALFSAGGVVACSLMVHGLAWPLALLLGLAAGAAVGLLSGGLVIYLGVPPFIATLAVFFAATGLVDSLVKGLITPLPDGFQQVAQDTLFGVPLLVWYAAVVGIVTWVVLRKTRFGYELRAVGGNRAAALASGISVRRIELTLYALSAGAAALAGTLYASRTSAGQPDAGGYLLTLEVLTMVLVGGVSLSGGVGSIGGVALGALLIGELTNALGVTELDPALSNVFIGVIFAVAVVLDGYRRRRTFQEEPTTRARSSAPSVSRHELERVITSRARVEAERIVSAVSTERKRIERDLHDGAQQNLVLLGLKLGVAQRLIEGDPTAAAAAHDELRSDIDRALTELRNQVHGIYPMALEREGLSAALAEAARRAAIPTETEFSPVARYSPELEAAVYFCCLEALQNAAKHAGPGARAAVRLAGDERLLRFSVLDDGRGFDSATVVPSAGMRNMRERIVGLGGSITIDASPGDGTRIAGEVPVAAGEDAVAAQVAAGAAAAG